MNNRYLNPQITQRMPQKIIDNIEKFAEEREISRTKAINDATDFYAKSKECIMCGAVNNGEGKVCSVCFSELFTDEIIRETIVDITISAINDEDGFEGSMIFEEPIPATLKNMDSNQLVLDLKSKTGDQSVKTVLIPQVEPIIRRNGGKTEYAAKIHFVAENGFDLVINGLDTEIKIKPEQVYMFAGKKYGKLTSQLGKFFKESKIRYYYSD